MRGDIFRAGILSPGWAYELQGWHVLADQHCLVLSDQLISLCNLLFVFHFYIDMIDYIMSIFGKVTKPSSRVTYEKPFVVNISEGRKSSITSTFCTQTWPECFNILFWSHL